MTSPIYKLSIIRGFREAHYQFSKEENDRLWSNVGKNEESAGAKLILACDARWGNEAYANWGIIEYPDLQAVQKVTRENEDNNLFRYVDSETYLGTKIDGFPSAPVNFQNPLYQLFLIKNQNNDLWESLAADTRDRIGAGIMESIQKLGGVPVIGCDTNWSSEEYAAFGVIAWPNLEAEQAHFKDIGKLGWHRYTYAKTILGTQHQE